MSKHFEEMIADLRRVYLKDTLNCYNDGVEESEKEIEKLKLLLKNGLNLHREGLEESDYEGDVSYTYRVCQYIKDCQEFLNE